MWTEDQVHFTLITPYCVKHALHRIIKMTATSVHTAVESVKWNNLFLFEALTWTLLGQLTKFPGPLVSWRGGHRSHSITPSLPSTSSSQHSAFRPLNLAFSFLFYQNDHWTRQINAMTENQPHLTSSQFPGVGILWRPHGLFLLSLYPALYCVILCILQYPAAFPRPVSV